MPRSPGKPPEPRAELQAGSVSSPRAQLSLLTQLCHPPQDAPGNFTQKCIYKEICWALPGLFCTFPKLLLKAGRLWAPVRHRVGDECWGISSLLHPPCSHTVTEGSQVDGAHLSRVKIICVSAKLQPCSKKVQLYLEKWQKNPRVVEGKQERSRELSVSPRLALHSVGNALSVCTIRIWAVLRAGC